MIEPPPSSVTVVVSSSGRSKVKVCGSVVTAPESTTEPVRATQLTRRAGLPLTPRRAPLTCTQTVSPRSNVVFTAPQVPPLRASWVVIASVASWKRSAGSSPATGADERFATRAGRPGADGGAAVTAALRPPAPANRRDEEADAAV
jgi:hypothetical protein